MRFRFFKKANKVDYKILIDSRNDLVRNLPEFKTKTLWEQICYFLYYKHEPIFYQEFCRCYLDEYKKD